jgi:hypothetical protein
MYVSPDNTEQMRPNLFKSTLPSFNMWDLKKGTKYLVHDRETVYLWKKNTASEFQFTGFHFHRDL